MRLHPNISELALYATEDISWLRKTFIKRHAESCEECRATVAEFQNLHDALAGSDVPEWNWTQLASDMRANIRLGLEAGECIRHIEPQSHWKFGLAAAFACVLVLIAAGIFLKQSPVAAPAPQAAAILATTPTGVELRNGSNSLTLLNHEGAVSSETASAQGAVRSRSIDAETGAVTITNVYLAE